MGWRSTHFFIRSCAVVVSDDEIIFGSAHGLLASPTGVADPLRFIATSTVKVLALASIPRRTMLHTCMWPQRIIVEVNVVVRAILAMPAASS